MRESGRERKAIDDYKTTLTGRRSTLTLPKADTDGAASADEEAGEPRGERVMGVGEAAGAVGERPRGGEHAERTGAAGATASGGAAAAGAATTRASSNGLIYKLIYARLRQGKG